MMMRSLAAASLLVLLPALPGAAQTTSTTYVFQTVEAYEVVSTSQVAVTGILQGESEARRIVIGWQVYQPASTSSYYANKNAERCERLALLAMAKPGRYLFSVTGSSTYSGSTPSACKLTLLPQE